MLRTTDLLSRIDAWSEEMGFADWGVARLQLEQDHERLDAWLARGLHGDLAYMARHGDKRREPGKLHEGTLSVLSFRMDYMPQNRRAALADLADPAQAYISRYALGRDYHKVMRGRLKKLAERLATFIGPFGYRVFTDSAPVLERALARNAGLGWIGKNTNLLTRKGGSLFFLGEIFTDLALPEATASARDHCGSCTRCMRLCPTDAFVEPYVLDARRCISYLTIELKTAIPEELRPLIGNRVFGCDDCQLVCPWNRYAGLTKEQDFAPRHGLDKAQLLELFELPAAAFSRITEGSALRRIGYEQWLRNLAVGLGNAPANPDVLRALAERREHPSPLVREHVTWALQRQVEKQAAQSSAPGT